MSTKLKIGARVCTPSGTGWITNLNTWESHVSVDGVTVQLDSHEEQPQTASFSESEVVVLPE